MGLVLDVGDPLTHLVLPDPERRFRGTGKHPDIPDTPVIEDVSDEVFAGRQPAALICDLGRAGHSGRPR